jgi:succinate dehydrogenase / fumarate reductase flavoprotein subunit
LEADDLTVTLDLSHMDPAYIEERLTPLMDVCQGVCDFDMGAFALDVAPSVAYTMGGLRVDLKHATTIDGLFAAGSCACAYHGAGVLGGNEMLSSLYGGMVAGENSVEFASSSSEKVDDVSATLLKKATDREEDAIARISSYDGQENAHVIEWELGDLLTRSAAVKKDNEELARALGKISELDERMDNASLLDRSEWANHEVFFMRRLRNRLKLARLIVDASIARDESRGAHYKPKFARQDDDKWLVYTKASWKQGAVVLDHSEKTKVDGS